MNNPIIIIGANLTGLCTALALSKLNQKTIIADRKALISNNKVKDGRAIALSAGSKQILETIGIWDKLTNFAGKIEQIRVTDQLSPLFLHFNKNETLGYLVESDKIIDVIYQQLLNDSNVTILAETNYELIENNYDYVDIKLNKQIHRSKLLIAADGKFSNLRKLCNIPYIYHNYEQSAIVCKVKHQFAHENIAQEMFLPNGPFAILPLKNPHHSGIVWTEKPELAEILTRMDKNKFNYFLEQKFTDYLGEVNLISEVASFPLELILAEKYYHNRIMLIGDSAHSIHPIAGQGFNLALRDIAAMMDLHTKYKDLGLAFGCYTSLKEYQKLRNGDNLSMAAITDSINKIFSNNSFPLNLLRKIGLSSINNIPALQKFFMEYAMAKRNKPHYKIHSPK